VLRYALLSSPYTQPMNFTFDLLTQARVSVERLQSRYERLREAVSAQPSGASLEPSPWLRVLVDRCRNAFDAALDDNLNVVAAFSAVAAFVSELNQRELAAFDAPFALCLIEELDEVLDVLDRRVRSGVLDKSELERFADPDYLREFADRVADWRSNTERAALHAALERGELPDADALCALTELDAEVTALSLGARHVWKKQREYQKADQLRRQLQQAKATIEDTPNGVRFRLP
jgi:cysteinyl-tRNA synthetase